MSEHLTGSDRGAAVVEAVPTRVLIVDDHPLVRQAVRETLAQESDLAVCGEAADEAAARQLVARLHPDLVLLDLSLGESNGMDLIPWMIQADPKLRVLVLSMHDEALYGERAIHAGARGYINKRATPDAFVAAIRTVLSGRIYLHPAIVDRILQRLADRRLEPVPRIAPAPEVGPADP
jgi:DNA-binding NarL/FixJ family response regulator